MSQRKHCSFKGCPSKQTPESSQHVTFFQFPRDEARFDIWTKLSRCENKDNTIKYLCSKHFDEHKYISTNPRRQLLLASAIPYAYVSDSEDNEDDQIQDVSSQFEAEEFIIQGVDVSDFDEADCNYAESTINEIEYDDQEASSKSYNYYNKKHKQKAEHDENEKPNKMLKMEYSAGQSLANKIRLNDSFSEELTKKNDVLQVPEEDVLSHPDITTFIFKGEEYIQMPRSIYIQEKTELVNSIQYYKQILMNLKAQVDNIKL